MGAAGGLPIFTPQPTEGIKHLLGYYEPPGPSLEKLRAFLNVMVYDGSQLTDELIKERFAASTQPDLLANPMLSRSRPVAIEPLWQKLANVRHKTLIIWGRDDRTVTLDGAFIMLNQMPDVRLHIFGKCGHWAQWEKAPEFNRLVIDFLSAGGAPE
jgi:pimeloyl-ACP methyl ester carboxylesterase